MVRIFPLTALAIGQTLAMALWQQHFIAASFLSGVVLGVATWLGGRRNS
jgi:hypothetical protein